jgi:chorismate dehydratase
MSKPRISVVRYLNTAPLVWGLLHGELRGKYDLDFTTPARCADAVLSGQAEVGIIPSIVYPRLPAGEIIRGLSISSLRTVRSVLLFSHRPIAQVRRVALDRASRTSVALLTVLLRKFYGVDFQAAAAPSDPASMLKAADAALVIGDPALLYHNEAVRVYDLAEEWHQFTGLPFVFAVWAGPGHAQVARFRQDLEDSRTYGLAHLEDIAAQYAPRLGMTTEEIKIYLTKNIDYNLGEDHQRSLGLFFRLASEVGIIPEACELRLV